MPHKLKDANVLLAVKLAGSSQQKFQMIFSTKLPKAFFFYPRTQATIFKGESGSASHDSLSDTANERWTDISLLLRPLCCFVTDSPVTVIKQEEGTVRGTHRRGGHIHRRGGFHKLVDGSFYQIESLGPLFLSYVMYWMTDFSHIRPV